MTWVRTKRRPGLKERLGGRADGKCPVQRPHQRPNLVIDQDGFTQFTRRNNQIHQAPDGRNQASKSKETR